MLGDEKDSGEPELEREEGGVYLISGVLLTSRVPRETGIDRPERPNARTMSGWLAANLGRLPQVGDEVAVPGGNMKVENVISHRADRIRVIVDDPEVSSDEHPDVPVSPAPGETLSAFLSIAQAGGCVRRGGCLD